MWCSPIKKIKSSCPDGLPMELFMSFCDLLEVYLLKVVVEWREGIGRLQGHICKSNP